MCVCAYKKSGFIFMIWEVKQSRAKHVNGSVQPLGRWESRLLVLNTLAPGTPVWERLPWKSCLFRPFFFFFLMHLLPSWVTHWTNQATRDFLAQLPPGRVAEDGQALDTGSPGDMAAQNKWRAVWGEQHQRWNSLVLPIPPGGSGGAPDVVVHRG